MNVKLEDRIRLRSSNINIIRFLSAIAVIACHSYAITSGTEDAFSRFTRGQCNLGGVAVAVFFFLSGIYVTKSLDRVNSVGLFLRKRCERIFPQLWIVVILSVIMGAVITVKPLGEYLTNKNTYLYLLNGLLVPIHDLPGVFEGMPYSTVNGPLWTMPVEFACYIGIAVIEIISVKLLKKQNARIKMELLFTAILFVMFIVIWIKMPDSMLVSVVRPVVIFFEGVLFYEYRDKIILNPWAALAALAGFVLMGFTSFFNLGLILLFPYAIAGLTLGIPQFKHDLKLFSISYEIYLVSWPIQQIVMMLAKKMSPAMNWLITLPFAILIGGIIYQATEKMMKRWAKRV